MRQPDQPYQPPPSGVERWPQGPGLPDAPSGASEWWLPADRLLSFGELWQFSLRLIAACFGPIALLFLFVRLPVNLANVYFEMHAIRNKDDDSIITDEELIPMIVFGIIGIATSLTILFAARDRLLENKAADLESLSRRVGHSFWPAITTEFLALIPILLGLVLCLAPGLVALSYFAFTLPAVALRGVRNWAALSYSRRMVRHNWRAVFTRMIVMFLPMVLVVAAYATLLSLSDKELVPEALYADPVIEFAWRMLGAFLVELAFLPWTLATLVLFLNLEAYKQRELQEQDAGEDQSPAID
ncbi:MAG: hypothetical protein NXI24_11685 [bacterium]|nr:hypothetical protein [bacterium]